MKYRKSEAKDYARENMKGIWAAAFNPMHDDFTMDEGGFSANIQHWIDDLAIDGVFVADKQGEFFSMSVAERKRNFEVAVEACDGRAGTIMSCSDQNFDTIIELATHAQNIGADYAVVPAPMLHFIDDQDDTVFAYYEAIAQHIDIAIAMWSHPDAGYLMSPQLCARVADIPNIVAIKYSVPRSMYVELTHLVGDRLLVSTASEEQWPDNIVELGWQLYLCSSPPCLLQTAKDRRMRQYTDLAINGDVDEARRVSESLQPVRDALRLTRPADKPQAHQKFWAQLLGQAGGPVRPPLLQLSEQEKAATRQAFLACGLRL